MGHSLPTISTVSDVAAHASGKPDRGGRAPVVWNSTARRWLAGLTFEAAHSGHINQVCARCDAANLITRRPAETVVDFDGTVRFAAEGLRG